MLFILLFFHLPFALTKLLHLRFDDVLMFDHLKVCVLARAKIRKQRQQVWANLFNLLNSLDVWCMLAVAWMCVRVGERITTLNA